MPGWNRWGRWNQWDGGIGGIGDFTEGGFLDEFDYPQLSAENLLKAPDDLTNGSYWTLDGVTPTEPSTGIFRLTKTAVVDKYIAQVMTNWFPAWAGYVSIVVSVQSDDLTAMSVALLDDGADAVTSAEVISGNANVAVAASIANITSIDGSLSQVRITGTVKSWATSVAIRYYPDKAGTTAGYVDTSLSQVILGDQPDEKPRPVAQETDYPMMAYRPNWRKTKDGSARTYVTDTEGLIKTGAATDINTNPATGTAVTADANPIAWGSFTCENLKFVDVMIRYTDASNWVKLRIHTDRQVQLIKNVSGTPTTVDTGSTLTDAELYRYELVALGSSVKAYIDDKLEVEGTITEHQTVAQARVEHDLATNDLRIVAESNPKGKGLIIAGGKVTPVYGDPGIWWTDPSGSAFPVGASDGMLTTATMFTVGEVARFGFDSDITGSPNIPYSYASSGGIYVYDVDGPSKTPQTLVGGEEFSFMQLLRSDTHGSHFLIHESGKEWKLFNANDDAIPAASAYPCIAGRTTDLFIKRIALLNLSSKWGGDFAEVLAENAAPPDTNVETITERTGQLHLQVTITRDSPVGSTNYVLARAADNTTSFVVGATNTDEVLRVYDYGTSTDLVSVAGVLLAGTSVVVDLIIELDGSFEIFADKVLQGSGTFSARANTIGKLESAHADAQETQEDLTTWPYPALGMADDRIVCPQDDDAGIQSNDFVAIMRNVVLPSTTNNQVWFRYVDADDHIRFYLTSDGTTQLFKHVGGVPTAIVSVGPGTTSDGETVMVVVDGVDGEMFVDGVSIGSNSNADTLAGDDVLVDRIVDGGQDAIELWKSREIMPFKI